MCYIAEIGTTILIMPVKIRDVKLAFLSLVLKVYGHPPASAYPSANDFPQTARQILTNFHPWVAERNFGTSSSMTLKFCMCIVA